MSEGNSPQVWRVVIHDSRFTNPHRLHDVTVAYELGGWYTDATGCHGLATPLVAVQEHAREKDWAVLEYVPPGQPTRDELALKIAELEARNADLAKDRDTAVATEREEGGKLCDLCAQFARLMGDAHAEKYEELAAAIRAGSRALLPLEVSRGA